MKRREFVKIAGGGVLLAAFPLGCKTTMETRPLGGTIKLDGIKVAPFSTSLVAVAKSALDHYGDEYSAPMVFGASGHAFMINIHNQLCPSGPYCWKMDGFRKQCRMLGVDIHDLGFSGPDENSAPEDRERIEGQLRAALADGMPCAMCNLDNQVITGYDETGLIASQQWGAKVPTTPAKLTYGSWKEFGKQFHVNFFVLKKTKPVAKKKVIRESLKYAVDVFENGKKHNTQEFYAVGSGAYDFWIAAVEEHGASHGNWWNARVWSECRAMASKYFAEIARDFPEAAEEANALATVYRDIGVSLQKAGNKKLAAKAKIERLADIQELERNAIKLVGELGDRI